MKSNKESIRSTFIRARSSGALDDVPGLVYGQSSLEGTCEKLVDTGIQRLLGDLDELPHPASGYQLLEPPGNKPTLGPNPLPAGQLQKHCKISSLVMTLGCRFRCSYCPIPAYNQNKYRTKSGERIADEMKQIANLYGISTFFGTDDNFFNDSQRTLDIAGVLASKVKTGRPFCKVRWATEATVHDTLRLKEHLPLIRSSGLVALWLGVEDISAALIRKGQKEEKTIQAFHLLRESGIHPIPMLMHHDSQPFYSWGNNTGLLNQLNLLRKAGALYMQVLMLVPSPGSKDYKELYAAGQVVEKVNGMKMEPFNQDGNYVITSQHSQPWIKQLNILMGYTWFYNPIRMLFALVNTKSAIPFSDSETSPANETQNYSRWKKIRRRVSNKLRAHVIDAGIQLFGMWGLFHTYRRTFRWLIYLIRGNIQLCKMAPHSAIPMRGVRNSRASHAIPGTPSSTDQQQIKVSEEELTGKSV